jgi:hypothetical protein
MGKRLVLALLILAAPYAAARRHHSKRPPEYRAFPPSRESLLEQNAEIDRWNLPRIKNDNELRELISDGELVQIQATPALALSPFLPLGRAYVRPWVYDQLSAISADFYAQFNRPLQVNSAVRTVKVQRWLLRTDRNAAPWHGEVASAHLAGVAVDLERRRLSPAQKRWLEIRLLVMAAAGAVIVEEEIRPQQCFHMVVRREKSGVPVFNSNPLPDSLDESGGESAPDNRGFVSDYFLTDYRAQSPHKKTTQKNRSRLPLSGLSKSSPAQRCKMPMQHPSVRRPPESAARADRANNRNVSKL